MSISTKGKLASCEYRIDCLFNDLLYKSYISIPKPIHKSKHLVEKHAKESPETTPVARAPRKPRRHLGEREEDQPDEEEAPEDKDDGYAYQREGGEDEESHSVPQGVETESVDIGLGGKRAGEAEGRVCSQWRHRSLLMQGVNGIPSAHGQQWCRSKPISLPLIRQSKVNAKSA